MKTSNPETQLTLDFDLSEPDATLSVSTSAGFDVTYDDDYFTVGEIVFFDSSDELKTVSGYVDDLITKEIMIPPELLKPGHEVSSAEMTELRAALFWDKLQAEEIRRKDAVVTHAVDVSMPLQLTTDFSNYYIDVGSLISVSASQTQVTQQDVMPKRLVTIRHNADYNRDTVEVLDGKNVIGTYSFNEINPHKLCELMEWFGYPTRVIDYMFEHDIAEFG